MRAIDILQEIKNQNERIELKIDSLLEETKEVRKINNEQLSELKKTRV